MKRFRFPLRPVAVLRAHRELKAREAFALSVNAYVRSEEELNQTRRRLVQFEAALFAGRRERFSAAEEAHTLAGYRRECAAEAAAEKAMLEARETMQKRRGDYLEAHRKLEVVKRLEAKARATHRADTNRAEQAEFDDFAGRAASRRAALTTP
jgi:flagellar FliJ protein